MKDDIAKLLEAAVAGLPDIAAAAESLSIRDSVERARDSRHGDFASNIAMRLAKPLRQKPRDIAERIIGQRTVAPIDTAGWRMESDLGRDVHDGIEPARGGLPEHEPRRRRVRCLDQGCGITSRRSHCCGMDHGVAAVEQLRDGGIIGDVADDMVDGVEPVKALDARELLGAAHERPRLVTVLPVAASEAASGEGAEEVMSLTFSPDGGGLVAATNNTLQIWEVDPVRRIFRPRPQSPRSM